MRAQGGEIEELCLVSYPHRWRILKTGTGPAVLCLHGAGGSADSFRPLMDVLSSKLMLVAPDLPGHGKTRRASSSKVGLDVMANDVATLMREMKVKPELLIGHSAGAAIALELDQVLSPRGHVLVNAALSEFDGLAGWVFPAMAKGLSITPFAADFLSKGLSREDRLRDLLESTGSDITDDIFRRYQSLVRSRDHVDGTLKMMATWDLKPLLQKLNDIRTPTLLIAANRDGTVPISVSKKAKQSLKAAEFILHEGGHLLHEEQPQRVAEDISAFIAFLDSQT